MDKNKTAEEEAESIYRRTLDNVIYPLLGKKTTFAKDLTRVGMRLFGNNFTGAHASDMIPDLGAGVTNANINKFSHLYAIANLDNSTMPGSHWIALAFNVDTRKIWVYDSFGRKTAEIIPSLVKKYGSQLKTVDRDAEQAVQEDDCGARSMAWLYVFDRYGVDVARLI